MLVKVQQKQRGFALFEAICCLSITVVVLMLVSIAFLQITTCEEEKIDRLNSFSNVLADIKRIEAWSNLSVATEKGENEESWEQLLDDTYHNCEIVEVKETITITTKTGPSIMIPTVTIDSEFLKEEFNYEITNQETIRLHID